MKRLFRYFKYLLSGTIRGVYLTVEQKSSQYFHLPIFIFLVGVVNLGLQRFPLSWSWLAISFSVLLLGTNHLFRELIMYLWVTFKLLPFDSYVLDLVDLTEDQLVTYLVILDYPKVLEVRLNHLNKYYRGLLRPEDMKRAKSLFEGVKHVNQAIAVCTTTNSSTT